MGSRPQPWQNKLPELTHTCLRYLGVTDTSLYIVCPLTQIYNYCFMNWSFKSYRKKQELQTKTIIILDFIFSCVVYLYYCLLVSKASDEKSAKNLIEAPLYETSCFSLAAFFVFVFFLTV